MLALAGSSNGELGRGRPVGTDDPGQKFMAGFKPHADQLHRFVSEMAGKGLRSAGDGLRTMASNIDAADDHSTVPGS